MAPIISTYNLAPTPGGKRWIPTSNVTPTPQPPPPPLRQNRPKLAILKKFQIFLALFGGPTGYCPPFSNSPSPATYPHIFFPTFRRFFSLLSSRFPPPSTSWSGRYFTYVQSLNRGDQHMARRPNMAPIVYYTLNIAYVTSIVSPPHIPPTSPYTHTSTASPTPREAKERVMPRPTEADPLLPS